MQSTWKFQKDKIDQKYRDLYNNSQRQTKKGEESYKELQKFHNEQKRQKEENKIRQGEYAHLLKTQVDIKNNGNKPHESDKPNHVYLGKYKLHRNSSLPMIPGIHSDSSLTGVRDLDTYNMKIKGPRGSIDLLKGANKAKNLLDSYKSTAPSLKHTNSAMRISSKHI